MNEVREKIIYFPALCREGYPKGGVGKNLKLKSKNMNEVRKKIFYFPALFREGCPKGGVGKIFQIKELVNSLKAF